MKTMFGLKTLAAGLFQPKNQQLMRVFAQE